jgi:hypothetical protein
VPVATIAIDVQPRGAEPSLLMIGFIGAKLYLV